MYALDPALLNIWGPGGFSLLNFVTVVGLVSIGIGFMGSPQVYVRFMAIESENEIDKGKWVAIIYTLLSDTGAVMIGILGRYILTKTGQDPEAVLLDGVYDIAGDLVGGDAEGRDCLSQGSDGGGL